MATAQEYADWLRRNQGRRGDADYQTVLRAFQEARLEELKTVAAPVAPVAQPESGFMPALRAGATELGGGISALMGKVGLKDMEKAQAEYDAAKKRAGEIFKPTEEGWTQAPLTKFGELLGGSVPYMAAPLAAGAAAAALPVTGLAALGLGLGAAGLTSAGQFTATNLARQMDEGKRLEETSLGSAAAAAVPQALLDTAAMRMIPGIGRIFGQAGIKITAENAEAIAKQGLKKTLADYGTKTFKTAGIEGVTEATQQVFERLQAGLSITDPKAREEYFDSFLGGAVLGGTLAPAGRFIERGREQREARGLLDAQAQKERAAAAKAEEEKKAQPEYLEGLYTSYQDLLTQKNALDAQIKKGTKEAPLTQEDKDANAVVNRQLNELKKPLEEARKAFIDAGGPQAMQKLRAGRLELTPTPPEARVPAVEEEEAPEAQRTRLTREASGLQSLLEQQRTAMQAAETPEEAVQIAQRAQQTYDALAKANETLGKLPQAPDLDALKKEETKLLKQFDDARAKGDQAEVMAVVPKLLEVRQQIKAAQPDLGLLSPEQIAAEQARQDELAGQISAGREAATATRLQSDTEVEFAREQAIADAVAEQQRQEAAYQARIGKLQEVRTAPQQTLLPEEGLPAGRPEFRPQPPLAERLNVLAERVLAAPNVDEETKGLVRQVQDNLPLLLQRETRPERVLGKRGEMAAQQAEAASVGAWLYRTLQGTAPADLTQDVRDRLAELEAGKRSETEQVTQYAGRALTPQEQQAVAGTSLAGRQGVMTREPTGEVRRAVQTEIAMPEPTATAFNDFKEFAEYLASDGLAALRNKSGIVGPTLARLEQFFAPMKAKADAFRADRQRLEALQKSLEGKSAEQKAAAQALVRDAERRVALARAQMEPLVEKLLALRDLAQQRYSDALTQGVDLAAQLYENTKTFRAQTEAQESMVDESRGAVVPKGAAADALVKVREARAEFEKRLGAWMAAETAKRDLVQANIGQDWGESSPLYQRYVAVKRTTDFARKDLDAARQRLASAQSKLTSFASLPDSVYENFLVKEAELQAQLQQQLRRINGFATNLKKVAKQTPELDAFIAQRDAEHVRVNQQLKSAGSGGVDVTALLKQSQARLQETLTAASDAVGYAGVEGQQAALDNAQAELAVALELQTQVAEEMALTETQARNIEPLAQAKARAANAIERRIQAGQRAAAQRAEARRQTAPAGETQAQREARDAEQRREEQARLERADTGPRTLVEFRRTETADENIRKFQERIQVAATAEERAAVRKELDEYLKARVASKEAALDEMKRKAAKNVQDLNEQRKRVAELTERLKGDLTPKRKATAEKQLAEAQRKMAEHQRRYLLNTKEMKVTRTDIQAQRQERNRLLAEASGRRVEGERLGVAEGTQARATGPVTRAEVTPPKALRTGSEESRAGATTTDTRQRLTEARGVQQRDVPIKASEQAEANRIAAELAKQTPEQKAAAAKEEAKVQEEQAKLQAKPAKVVPLSADKPADAFLKAWSALTTESPKEKGVRFFGDIEVAADKRGDNVIKIDLIRNIGELRQGKAAAVLRKLTELADTHGVTLTLMPQKVGKKGPSSKTLAAWYARNGFKEWDAGMYRQPQKQAAAPKKKSVEQVVEEIEEDLYEEPEIELLGGPEEEVFLRETGPQYETRELTGLTPEVREALEDGDIRTALADLAKNGSTPFVRELAKRLADMTMRTKLEVRDKVEHKGEEVEGVYVAAENLVLLHRNALSEEALTHELTHAATMRALEADPATLTPAQRAARKEIENLYAAIQKQPDFAREYGRKDVKEFVSELMSNLDFRNKLDAQKPSFLRRMYDALMRLIGFPRAPASERAVKAAYALFMPSQAIKAAPAASARRGAPGLATANRVADSLIAQEKGVFTKLKENFLGMGARTQFVDKLAPTEEALKRGGTDPTKALQAMYYLRMYDQRMHFTSQSITEGVPELVEKTRADGKTERIIETKPGANIQQIVNILKAKDVVKAAGSPDAANKLFTLYLAAIRGDRVGYSTLNFGRVWAEAEVKRLESQLKSTTLSQEQRSVLQKRKKDLADKIPTMPTEADIKAARAEIEADPTLKKAFDEARDIYNQYNRNLLEFSVQTGALSRDEANKYLRNNDYIPYYRMRDGVAELMIGNETPIRIGNLKDSPHLKELVGGDEAIFDFLTSSVQNTSMLLDMATKNLATKNLMFEFRDVGLATVSKVPKSGKTPEGAVTFKRDGEDYFAVVDTDTLGIDSDLLVKGLAGIPTMFPAFIRVLGIPARLLRRVVVASPVYMARQLFRDSLAATLSSGADMVPVLSSLQQIGKPKALQGRGITGGQVFTGMPEDVTRMLKDMQAGKISVTNGLAWLEAKSAQVDALTREAQYESYRKQGLSEMEATLMALESMNFSKRGLSPTMHMVSTLIPFFNAQIQGLDVLYKAFTGQMPLNERLAIREKLWTRGLMLAGLSVAYAVAMQDDETYENAKPEEKYGNWFVRVPGFEQMVRLPIPFELGYIFKALPEAIVNTVMNEKGGEEAGKAFKHIAQQMVPGLSSYFLPQAVKPALEALAFETSLYTGRSIESAKEQMMQPGFRYRENTTALAREVGELTGFSPIKMEFLIRGYTGGMGMALLAALSAPFGKEGPESATKRASDMPVVGTLFQPNDASGIIDATYERMKQINQVKETYEGLIEKGRIADANKYLTENASEMALASVAGSFKQVMGEVTKYEREVRASNMSPEEKRQKLDEARQIKIRIASSVRAMAGKKEPQAALP
jgi:hypothetical protein